MLVSLFAYNLQPAEQQIKIVQFCKINVIVRKSVAPYFYFKSAT